MTGPETGLFTLLTPQTSIQLLLIFKWNQPQAIKSWHNVHSWALCGINRSITDLKMVFRGRILTCRAVLLSLPSVPQSTLTTYCLHKTFYIKCWTLKSTYLPSAIFSMQMPSYLRCCCLFSKWHFQGIPTTAQRSLHQDPGVTIYQMGKQQWFALRDCSVIVGNGTWDTGKFAGLK